MKKILAILALAVAGGGFVFGPELMAEENSETPVVEKKTEAAEALSVGDMAPGFSLKNVDDAMVSLADVLSTDNVNGAIVTFTCNTCPYAVMYEDRLIDLHNNYASQGWPVIAINPNDPDVKPGDSFNSMKERSTAKEFPFAYLFDEGQKVYPEYGATKTPHVFLVDKSQKVRYIGAIDNNPQDADAVTEKYLEDAIAAIGAGNDPDPNFTKAIGCSIKVKK